MSSAGDLTVLYHAAPHDRPLSLIVQGPDRAFYFRTLDMDPSAILRFDPDSLGKTTVQISEAGAVSPLGSGKAFLRLARSGDVSQALTIRYAAKGDAVAGSDYEAFPGNVTFQPGRFDAVINVSALPTVTAGRRLLIKLRPTPGSNYIVVPGRNEAGFEFVPEASPGG